MTERVLGPTGGRRRKRLVLLVPFMALGALILAISSATAGVSADAGFEGNDGNLSVQSTVDWNTFDTPLSWPNTAPNTAPYRVATTTASGWTFTGIEDAQNDGSDSVFNGGVKQDKECAGVGPGPKPPNKDDLKRIYIASKTATAASGSVSVGDVILALSWLRIPQNTVNASAHVGFEFNQSDEPCGAGSDGLVERTADNPATASVNEGDMLIVYDFEGSTTDVPVLKLLRWQVTGICEQTGKAATSDGCWVLGQNLTALGNAEAKVFASPGNTVLDQLAPPTPPATQAVDQNIGDREFGEAVVNLTDAGVFPASATSCVSFGKTFAVSRSSGDSGQAAMKDIAGPADVDISNCGGFEIVKTGKDARCASASDTDPTNCIGAGERRLPGATFSVTGPSPSTSAITGSPFTTGDDGKVCVTGVLVGSYAVTETAAPTGYQIDDAGPQTAVVSTSSTCSNLSKLFTDTPLTDLSIDVTAQAAGRTASTVSCVDSSNTAVGTAITTPVDPANYDAEDLEPDTYTCTIFIDP